MLADSMSAKQSMTMHRFDLEKTVLLCSKNSFSFQNKPRIDGPNRIPVIICPITWGCRINASNLAKILHTINVRKTCMRNVARRCVRGSSKSTTILNETRKTNYWYACKGKLVWKLARPSISKCIGVFTFRFIWKI